MSVAGRNAIKGSRLSAYRPTETDGTGGQINRAWVPLPSLQSFGLELHTPTDEIVRRVYGAEIDITCAIYVQPYESAASLQEKDGLHVESGRHAGTRFIVRAKREVGRLLELGLAETDEVFS